MRSGPGSLFERPHLFRPLLQSPIVVTEMCVSHLPQQAHGLRTEGSGRPSAVHDDLRAQIRDQGAGSIADIGNGKTQRAGNVAAFVGGLRKDVEEDQTWFVEPRPQLFERHVSVCAIGLDGRPDRRCVARARSRFRLRGSSIGTVRADRGDLLRTAHDRLGSALPSMDDDVPRDRTRHESSRAASRRHHVPAKACEASDEPIRSLIDGGLPGGPEIDPDDDGRSLSRLIFSERLTRPHVFAGHVRRDDPPRDLLERRSFVRSHVAGEPAPNPSHTRRALLTQRSTDHALEEGLDGVFAAARWGAAYRTAISGLISESGRGEERSAASWTGLERASIRGSIGGSSASPEPRSGGRARD